MSEFSWRNFILSTTVVLCCAVDCKECGESKKLKLKLMMMEKENDRASSKSI